MDIIQQLISASATSNSAQRNWDHTATIPQEHVDALIEVVKNSPTKQNEVNYKLYVFTDPEVIYKIYSMTKTFSVPPRNSMDYTDNRGFTEEQYNVTNSQINSQVLFAFCQDWDQGQSRTLKHKLVEERPEDVHPDAVIEREWIRLLGTGVAVGELILSANMMGYRTGLCTAVDREIGEFYCNDDEVVILVGVGIPRTDLPRNAHDEYKNKDIAAEDRRNGELEEPWLFPKFIKNMTVIK